LKARTDLLDLSHPGAYLRSALHHRQFSLYCQRVLALKSGSGHKMAEIFVRMHEEESAFVPPGEFLPMFEYLKMMPELDRWVVSETVNRSLRSSVIDSFCVKISRQTYDDPSFPAFVVRELGFAGAPAERLTFQLSEADIAACLPAASRLAQALHNIGTRVIVEDFRCQRESFELLGALRADYLKVDGRIVRKLLSSDAALAAMHEAVEAAAAAGKSVIAETVEDEATLAAVRELGVDYAQGFGIHIPSPIGSVIG
jgi:EAL domain-containing protein (putative c-di-GMP-specific phosphodiesterase class I)